MPRTDEDLTAPEAGTHRRYHCRNPDCGWEGLIDRRQYHRRQGELRAAPSTPAVVTDRSWTRTLAIKLFGLAGTGRPAARRVLRAPLTMFLAGFLAAVLAGGGVLAVDHRLRAPATAAKPLLSLVPSGDSTEGEDLPQGHPLLASAEADPVKPADTRLTLKHRCAWGKPGGNPYKGTVEEALNAARLPPEVIRDVADRIHRRDTTDRLTIRSGSIRGDKTGTEFDPRSVAMTYGRTMCLGTRVNFAPGHSEPADLYTVSDRAGRRYSVMVPDVCGNVSVLSEAGKAMPTEVLAASQTIAEAEPRYTVSDLVENGGNLRVVSLVIESPTRSVPLPGTLSLVALGLAALGYGSRLRARRRQHSP